MHLYAIYEFSSDFGSPGPFSGTGTRRLEVCQHPRLFMIFVYLGLCQSASLTIQSVSESAVCDPSLCICRPSLRASLVVCEPSVEYMYRPSTCSMTVCEPSLRICRPSLRASMTVRPSLDSTCTDGSQTARLAWRLCLQIQRFGPQTARSTCRLCRTQTRFADCQARWRLTAGQIPQTLADCRSNLADSGTRTRRLVNA